MLKTRESASAQRADLAATGDAHALLARLQTHPQIAQRSSFGWESSWCGAMVFDELRHYVAQHYRELGIMLESYREAFVTRINGRSRAHVVGHDWCECAERIRRAERLARLGTMAAGLAHEIRNPINAAQLQCLALKRRLDRLGVPHAAEARDVADLVMSELERVEALVSEFLQYARPRPIVRRSSDLAAIVDSVVAIMDAEADSIGVSLSVEHATHVTACVDEESIRQVLHNLIRNAIEACHHGCQVRVELMGDEHDAVIRVVDDGHGLPANSERLFEPFFTSKDTGTGLGLAIVQRIVTEHHGRIDARRDRDETVFTVRLPLEPS